MYLNIRIKVKTAIYLNHLSISAVSGVGETLASSGRKECFWVTGNRQLLEVYWISSGRIRRSDDALYVDKTIGWRARVCVCGGGASQPPALPLITASCVQKHPH